MATQKFDNEILGVAKVIFREPETGFGPRPQLRSNQEEYDYGCGEYPRCPTVDITGDLNPSKDVGDGLQP